MSGILIRKTTGNLVIRCYFADAIGNPLNTGTSVLSLFQLLTTGALATLDFSDKVFKTSAATTPTANMTYQSGNAGGINTGLWTYPLSLTGLTNHASSTGVIFGFITNSSAIPPTQAQEFQLGGAEGDLTVSSGKLNAIDSRLNFTGTNVQAVVQSIAAAALDLWTVYTSHAFDHVTNVGYYVVSAEKNGEQALIKNATVKVYDAGSGAQIFTASGTLDATGKKFFSLIIPDMSTLLADRVYYIETVVIDMTDTTRTSGASQQTLD